MYVVRGVGRDARHDRSITHELLGTVERTDEPAVRVWTPPKQVAFGRRDAASDGYERAERIAADRGYEPIERSVGGRAVAYTGRTVAFARAVPTGSDRSGIDDRYREAMDRVSDALEATGAAIERGEPERSFCPGTHSLRGRGSGKIAGLAQRVRQRGTLVGGCVVVDRDDPAEIAGVLEPIYDALGVAFDPASVGSLAECGGSGTVPAVVERLEDALVGDRPRTVTDAASLATDEPSVAADDNGY